MYSTTADAITYHRGLAIDWDRRYDKAAFRSRESVLSKCLQGRDLTGSLWLDAGCGTGTLSRWLAARGCRVLGLDAAPEMVQAANQLAASYAFHHLRFSCIQSIAQLPVPDNGTDGVLCSSVLEYVSDPYACLKEFARILKRGGLLIVSVPNRRSLVRQLQVACHRSAPLIGMHCMEFLNYSHQQYSPSQFDHLLTRSGFSVKKRLPFGSPLPRLARYSRLWVPLLLFVAEKL